MTTPEEKSNAPDELERLEQMHRRMKEEQEAWRNLLESLENLKKKHTETTDTEKPKP